MVEFTGPIDVLEWDRWVAILGGVPLEESAPNLFRHEWTLPTIPDLPSVPSRSNARRPHRKYLWVRKWLYTLHNPHVLEAAHQIQGGQMQTTLHMQADRIERVTTWERPPRAVSRRARKQKGRR